MKPKIIIYGFDGCGPCSEAKGYMKSHGIEFESRYPTLDQVIPRIHIGRWIMVGWTAKDAPDVFWKYYEIAQKEEDAEEALTRRIN